ncbi:YopJ -like peptidase, Cysteine peptidase, MEROPSfamily C55 [Bartonella sp. CDC_skunk]|uniref:YopJ/AvrA family T3SS effector serine/threonine acetyltransferase n=1 Tax=Bartonella sp. CDC_skunk TaxID=1933905 RepID=UPI000999652D|nr:YopJ/AvrA family T3SS effector serine/threonine acetyltransferase [Bartonella sp. CDC_skunk]AQX21088.1 YopJ -like peptidase, Cysteine peptidase, MEROPSfamily C55 [Bartonella sp. CDC_skunk]
MLQSSSPITQANDSLIAEGNETLEDLIIRLENDIFNGKWIEEIYSDIDFKMMPALIKQANNKYPEMNLRLVTTFEDLRASVQKTIGDGIQSSRFIVNVLTDVMPHFVVIDHKTINNKLSFILFECARCDNKVSLVLISKVKKAIEGFQLPDFYCSIVEMDIQRSMSECGIFSLALAKKLYLRSDKLEKLHRDNIKGDRWDRDVYLSHDLLDIYLPIDFYKHVQGLKRLEEYVKKNPGSEKEIVNKKNETIFERFERHTMVKRGKNMSASAHKKRITEYKSLMR